MNLPERFTAFIKDNQLFTSQDTLLLTVSGGLDSVVLCDLCHTAGFPFRIAHCNFQLRGEESLRDKAFVTALASHYQVPLLQKDFDTEAYARERQLGIQVAARELRYEWFASLTPGLIVTAHHLDDNIETLLMNFFKGTGIAGLHGILPRQGKIVRPLLFARKEELATYAAERQLSWVEDSSNASDKYSRNYVRHQLMPVLQKLYPGVEQQLAANINRFREIEILYRQSIDLHKKKLLEARGAEWHIPVLKLQKTVPLATVLYEIIREFGFSPRQTDEVMALLDSSSGKYVQSSTHRIIRNRAWLIIAPLAPAAAQHVVVESVNNEYEYAQNKICLAVQPASQQELPASPAIAHLDVAAIRFPLLLRPWKAGDYFYPLGMKKKKKVARFLIDQKLSKADKEKVWVLEMDKKIVWVIGHRIDDRFKVTPSTKQVLRLVSETV